MTIYLLHLPFGICYGLTVFLMYATSVTYAQTVNSTVQTSSSLSNFTSCQSETNFAIVAVQRQYSLSNSTYSFNIYGQSLIPVRSIDTAGQFIPSAQLEIMVGFTSTVKTIYSFCPDAVNGCPITPGASVVLSKSVTIPSINLPLADISAHYSVLTAEKTPLLCTTLASVGYQHTTWRYIFILVPIVFAVFAVFVSLIVSFSAFNESEYDIFLFISNYAILPAILRLKTPGLFDLIYYAQFIVTTGQLSLSYPAFYSLFTSNFSWSFFLIPVQWINAILKTSLDLDLQDTTNRAGIQLIKRQVLSTLSPLSSLPDGSGTGMGTFANAVGMNVNMLFMTCLILFLIVLGGCLVLCFLTWCVMLCLACISPYRFGGNNSKMRDLTLGIALRVLTLAYLPLITTALYQLMLPTSEALLGVASVVIVFPLCLLYGYIAFALLHIKPSSMVFSDMTLLLRYGSLYNTYTDDHIHFSFLTILYKVFVGVMVGIFQASGVAQLTVILIAEVVLLSAHIRNRPYVDAGTNTQYTILSTFRLVITLLNISYVDSLKASITAKQYVAYTQVILHSIVFLCMFILPLKNLIVLAGGLGEDEIYNPTMTSARMSLGRGGWKRAPFHSESTTAFGQHYLRPTSVGGSTRPRIHMERPSLDPRSYTTMTNTLSFDQPPPIPLHTSTSYHIPPVDDTQVYHKPNAVHSPLMERPTRPIYLHEDPGMNEPLVSSSMMTEQVLPRSRRLSHQDPSLHRQYTPQLTPTSILATDTREPSMPPQEHDPSYCL